MKDTINGEVPVGLSMALAQNLRALERFSMMTQQQRENVVKNAHGIESKEQMQSYVNKIAEGAQM